MKAIATPSNRRNERQEFVRGRVGILDYASDSILVLPRSQSFSTARVLNNEATKISTFLHTIVMEEGVEPRIRLLPGRFIRRIGYVVISDTEVRWSEDEGESNA